MTICLCVFSTMAWHQGKHIRYTPPTHKHTIILHLLSHKQMYLNRRALISLGSSFHKMAPMIFQIFTVLFKIPADLCPFHSQPKVSPDSQRKWRPLTSTLTLHSISTNKRKCIYTIIFYCAETHSSTHSGASFHQLSTLLSIPSLCL